jgi:glycosyltransferase involved in cell wall biosynthesis
VLTDSEHSRKDVLRFLRLDSHKVQVLPLAVGEEYRPVTQRGELERVWARYGVKAPYVLYVGNFKPHKNVQTLLRAFALLCQRQPALQLVLGGRLDRWAEERRRLAAELGIAARVCFTGAVAAGDLPALYSGAAVFAFPSRYEGFGLPPLEAMGCGTPVVAGNATSLPEVVGQAGVLVDPGDAAGLAAALGHILEDERERRRLGELGLARAELFRPPVIYERQLRVLEGLGARE